jgi:hypothetical protein
MSFDMRAAVATLVLCCLAGYSQAQASNSVCYASGERCFSSPGSPEVTSKPCCENLTCTGVDETANFSLVCETPSVAPSPPASPSAMCYAQGERCSGLQGFPVQPVLPCCDSLACTALGPFGMYCETPATAPSTSAPPKCYAEGQRCTGAPGFPNVPYMPCCGSMTCSARDAVFGLACEASNAPSGQCYSAGQRCVGAPGFPAVPFFPCCGRMTCTAADPNFGLACEDASSGPGVIPPPQCYGEGQRCIGAPNFPQVPFLPCCGEMTCSAADPVYGFACQNGPSSPSPSPSPQCYAVGQRCIGAQGFPAVPYLPCCENMTCSARDPSYGFACETPSPDAPAACYAEGQRCIGAPGFPAVPYFGCCGGMTCTAKDAQYGLACENPVSVPTPSLPALPNTPPQCYAEGQRCIGAPGFPAVPYIGCCGDMTCTAKDAQYGLACEDAVVLAASMEPYWPCSSPETVAHSNI